MIVTTKIKRISLPGDILVTMISSAEVKVNHQSAAELTR